MKTDVEGFENEVLLRSEDVLREIRPDVIILETNEQNLSASVSDQNTTPV
jgi:hypothetical protein